MPRGLARSAPVAALVALGLLVGGGGCSAILGSDVPAFQCLGSDLRACPEGQFCRGTPGKPDQPGACAPCEPRDVCDGFDNDCNGKVDDSQEREICDGIDNDCNGKVDDGPLADRDGDGTTFCGRIDPGSGKPLDIDCNDEDAEVHPGAAERCNGKDDDCDGAIDDGACPSGQTCAPKRERCVDDAAVCTPANCPAPKACDPDTLECITPAASKPGDPCTSSRACDTGICGDAATLGKAVTDVVGNVCTRPCCGSAECGREQVCLATGAGGSYCVPRAAVGVTVALGEKAAGETCQGDGDCRSGSCDATARRCVDTCCSDAQCRGGTRCRFAPSFRGHPAYTCQANAGTLDNGGRDRCEVNSECKSGLCLVVYDDGLVNVKRCAPACCGTGGCPGISYVYGFETVSSRLACRNAAANAQGEVVSACSQERQSAGAAKVGAPCASDASCESELCLTLPGGEKRCTDVCCTDADCAGPGWVCRPTPVTSKLYLRCVPR